MTVVQGEYLRVSVNFELGGGVQYQNIWHYLRDGVDVASDANTIAGIKARIEATYATIDDLVENNVVEKLSFVDRVAWIVNDWKVESNIGTFVPDFTPTDTGDALPYQSAPFIVFKTTRPKSVGKKFLFPFTETWQDSTILDGTAVTAMVAFGVSALLDIGLGGDAVLLPGILRTGVEVWLTFQTAVVNDVIGSQRRRRPGVGA